MSDGEHQIVQLLMELRDAQREDLDYRRRVLEESMMLQRRSIRFQRLGLAIILGAVVLVSVLIVLLNLAANRERQTKPPVALQGGNDVAIGR